MPMLYEAGALCIAIVFFFVIFRMQGIGSAVYSLMRILRPFVIGLALAYLLTPCCRFFERLLGSVLKSPKTAGIKKTLGIVLSMLSLLLVIYVLLSMIVPQLYSSILSLRDTLPAGFSNLQSFLEKRMADNPELVEQLNLLYDTAALRIRAWLETTLLPELRTLVGGFGSGVLSVFVSIKDALLGLAVAIYALASRRTIKEDAGLVLYSLVPGKWADLIAEECRFADRMFSGFLSGKLVDSLIVGAICYVFCLIADMPSGLLVAAVIGITNIIPVFGPFIGAIPTSFIILIQSPIKCLWFILFILALQQVDGNIIGPKILGNSTGLSGFAVLFAIVLFGGLFGFLGMIIGVPLFAVIDDILSKLVYLGLKRNGREDLLMREDSAEKKES